MDNDIVNDMVSRSDHLQKLDDEVNQRTRFKTVGGVEYVVDGTGKFTFSEPVTRYDLLNLARSFLNYSWTRFPIRNANEEIKTFLQMSLSSYQYEVFAIIYIGDEGKFIKFEKLSYGNENNVVVPIKTIIATAIICNAASIIVSHNHPLSEIAGPSRRDKLVTGGLMTAAIPLGIDMTDHIVVTKSDVYSFRENGLLETIKDIVRANSGG